MRIDGSELEVEALAEGFSLPVRVGVGDEVREFRAGDRCTFSVASASPSA